MRALRLRQESERPASSEARVLSTSRDRDPPPRYPCGLIARALLWATRNS